MSAAILAGSVLPRYGRDAPTIGVLVLASLAAAIVVALLIARRRR